MTLESIKNMSSRGYSWYEIQQVVEQAKKATPTKPKRPNLKDKHNSVEAEEYFKALKLWEIEMVSYKAEFESFKQFNNNLDDVFELFLIEESGLTKFSQEKQVVIWNFYYNTLRSADNIVDKYQQIMDIIDFISEISKLESI